MRGSNHPDECVKNQSSYDAWNERLKSGMPPQWEFKNEKFKAWTDEEKEKTLDALSILPEILLSQSVNGIYRLKKSEQLDENPAAGFQNQIALYNEAFNSKYKLAQILGHEISHFLFQKFSLDEQKAYYRASDWRPFEASPGKLILIPARAKYVEEDGKNRPDEDFANNIEYFMFNPKALMETSPQVFNWIKQKYGDKLNLREVRK